MGTFLSQLSRMGVLWPAFGRFIDAYPVAFSLLQGALSPAVTALVFLTSADAYAATDPVAGQSNATRARG